LLKGNVIVSPTITSGEAPSRKFVGSMTSYVCTISFKETLTVAFDLGVTAILTTVAMTKECETPVKVFVKVSEVPSTEDPPTVTDPLDTI